MLKIIRRKVGWTMKIVLGMIAVSFAIYFGYNSIQNQGNITAALKVGGEEISMPKYQLFLDREFDRLREQFKTQSGDEAEIPEFYQQIAANAARQRLTFRNLMKQFAKEIGLTVTDLEIAKFVSREPGFDPVSYKSSINSFYLNTGVPYEELLREDLTVGNFQSWSERVDGPRNPPAPDTVAPGKVTPATAATKTPTWTFETVTLKTTDKKEVAEKIQTMWHKGGDAKRLLSKEKLEIETVGPLTIEERSRLLSGQLNFDETLALFLLQPGRGPSNPIQKGENFHGVRLIKRENADKTASAEYRPIVRPVDLWFNHFAKETPVTSLLPEEESF